MSRKLNSLELTEYYGSKYGGNNALLLMSIVKGLTNYDDKKVWSIVSFSKAVKLHRGTVCTKLKQLIELGAIDRMQICADCCAENLPGKLPCYKCGNKLDDRRYIYQIRDWPEHGYVFDNDTMDEKLLINDRDIKRNTFYMSQIQKQQSEKIDAIESRLARLESSIEKLMGAFTPTTMVGESGTEDVIFCDPDPALSAGLVPENPAAVILTYGTKTTNVVQQAAPAKETLLEKVLQETNPTNSTATRAYEGAIVLETNLEKQEREWERYERDASAGFFDGPKPKKPRTEWTKATYAADVIRSLYPGANINMPALMKQIKLRGLPRYVSEQYAFYGKGDKVNPVFIPATFGRKI